MTAATRTIHAALLFTLAVLLGACNTCESRMRDVHQSFYEGRLSEAVNELEVRAADDPDDPMLLGLELAMALQAAGRYEESSQLLIRADDELEVFDYTTNRVADIASFAFGGESEDYRANRPERVMVNTENVLNFLGMGDREGAAVEARRIRTLLDQQDMPAGEWRFVVASHGG